MNSNSCLFFFVNSVDSYSSHEGIIYCKPHFKQLFQPKAVFEIDESKTSMLFIYLFLNITPTTITTEIAGGDDDNDNVEY